MRPLAPAGGLDASGPLPGRGVASSPMTTVNAERWDDLVAAMLATGDATYGNEVGGGNSRAFGSNALKTEGRIFALLSHDRLVVKLPAKRVQALIEDGLGRRFDPGHGRLMREWLDVSVDDPETWQALANEALTYVAEGRS